MSDKGHDVEIEYMDDYPTCAKTHASLRIIHDNLDPDAISAQLGIAPTWNHRKGEPRGPNNRPAYTGVWGLSTEGKVDSRDLRRHVDWLADQVSNKADVLEQLRAQGYEMDVFCLWYGSGGSGGPILSPRNMLRLGALGLELGIECYEMYDDTIYTAIVVS